MKKVTKTKTEYICDVCGEHFDTEQACLEHEQLDHSYVKITMNLEHLHPNVKFVPINSYAHASEVLGRVRNFDDDGLWGEFEIYVPSDMVEAGVLAIRAAMLGEIKRQKACLKTQVAKLKDKEDLLQAPQVEWERKRDAN